MKSCIVPCDLSSFTTATVTDAAYCDKTTDGGGWIVIQGNKKDSSVTFNRNWTDYEKGFGNLVPQNFGMDWQQYIVYHKRSMGDESGLSKE